MCSNRFRPQLIPKSWLSFLADSLGPNQTDYRAQPETACKTQHWRRKTNTDRPSLIVKMLASMILSGDRLLVLLAKPQTAKLLLLQSFSSKRNSIRTPYDSSSKSFRSEE